MRRQTAEVEQEAPPTTATPVMPSAVPIDAAVNLLSPWVMDELRVRRLQLRFLGGLAALALVLCAAWAGLGFVLKGEESSLSVDEAQADVLQAQVTDMAPVRGYAAAVTKRGRDVTAIMASEVAFSRAATELDASLPRGLALAGVDLALVVDPAAPGSVVDDDPGAQQLTCPGPDPFGARTIVGCVTLSGTAGSRQEVSELVSTLAKSEFFVEPFISTTTTGEDAVEFSGTVGLDPRLLRGEYVLDPAADPEPTSTEETP